MKIVKDLNLPFYLTGGTALSRFYFNHRFSDDLDLFVNRDINFHTYQKNIVETLQSTQLDTGIKVITDRIVTSEDFLQLYLSKGDIELKVDFVNDISSHFGEFLIDAVYGKIDNLRNILSNKISALYRFEIKDFVDIRTIAKNYKFNWQEIINEAKQKEASIDPLEIYNLFLSFPFENLTMIKWIKEINLDEMQNDFLKISDDILVGGENSLY